MSERRMRIAGIHHITLLVADVERSLAFYRNVLGLRLVKQTVDVEDLHDQVMRHFALAVESEAELAAWHDYLVSRGIPTTDVMDRSDFKSIYLRDPDGHIVEIAAG